MDGRGSFDKIPAVLASFAFLFTPLLFFMRAHDQFELPKLTFLAVLALPWLFLSWKGPFPRPTVLSYALLSLFAVQTLSAFSPSSLSWRNSLFGDYDNFAGLLSLAVYLAWFQGLARYWDRDRMVKCMDLNTLAALLSSLYAVGQHFGFDSIRWNPGTVNSSREFASLGNPNFLSAYLALSMPLALASMAEKEGSGSPRGLRAPALAALGLAGLALELAGTYKGMEFLGLSPSEGPISGLRALGLLPLGLAGLGLAARRGWAPTLAVLSILALGLFSTGSRGGFLGALAGCFLWLALASRREGPLRRGWVSLASFLASHGPAVLASLGLGILFGRSFFLRLLSSLAHPLRSLEESRLHIWGPALEMVKAHPWLGVGLDNFKTAFPYYSGIEFNRIDGMFVSSRTAHNELLQTAATTGLLGLAASLGVLGAFLFLGLGAWRLGTPKDRAVLAGVLSAALAFQVQDLFSFGVASINFLWFSLLSMVQALHRERTPAADGVPAPSWRFTRKALLLLTGLAFLLFPLPRLGADLAFGKSAALSNLLREGDPSADPETLRPYSDEQVRLLERAAGVFPSDVKYLLYLGLAYEQRAGLERTDPGPWLQRALGAYQKTVAMSPANAYYYNNEGRIWNALGDIPRASQAYGQAVQWAPASPFFRVNWAMALEKEGRKKEAEEQWERSFGLDRPFTARLLSQMAFDAYKRGERSEAFERADRAVQGDPSNALALYGRGILYLSEKRKKEALADLMKVRALGAGDGLDPQIQNLDLFIEEAGGPPSAVRPQPPGNKKPWGRPRLRTEK